MFLKYILPFFQYLWRTLHIGADIVRGLTWSETRDLLQFARRRVREESLPQVAEGIE